MSTVLCIIPCLIIQCAHALLWELWFIQGNYYTGIPDGNLVALHQETKMYSFTEKRFGNETPLQKT